MTAPAPPNPDKAELASVGREVRARLGLNRRVARLPTDKAEIHAVEAFLEPAECETLIAMIDEVAKPSLAFDAANAPANRSSYSGDVDPWDPFVMEIQQRIDTLLGLPAENGETIQGQRYREGQEFRPHFDWFDTARDYWQAEERRGGQRCYTAMAFLNDVEAGGETAFPLLGMRISPCRGLLLVWNNATPEGEPNEATLHAGLPVARGSKYIVTKWYRTRRWS